MINPAVRPDNTRRAQNDIVRAIWAVACRIGGTEESNGRNAKCDREMKRASIAADDAGCVAQESHQWSKRTIVKHRISVATAFADGESKIVLTGTEIHHATQANGISNHFAEVTKSFRRPALRTPAAAGTQDDVAIESELLQIIANSGVIYL